MRDADSGIVTRVEVPVDTSATPSLRSATKPASDMDMMATTLGIPCAFLLVKTRFTLRRWSLRSRACQRCGFTIAV